MSKATTIALIVNFMREEGISATQLIAADSYATTRGLSLKDAYENHQEDIDADADAMGVFIEPYWDWHDLKFVMGTDED